MIPLVEALKEMEKKDEAGAPVPFSIEVYTYDRKRKTGGELLSLENVVLSKSQKKGKTTSSPDINSQAPKAPNHFRNSTRNLLILSSRQIRKCHIRLIHTFNGKPVYW